MMARMAAAEEVQSWASCYYHFSRRVSDDNCKWLTKPRFISALGIIPAAVLFTCLTYGIDYGRHWDEDWDKNDAVIGSIENGYTFLPDG